MLSWSGLTMTNEAMRQLGVVSRAYEKLATDYRALAIDAAHSESDYRKIKAQTMLREIAAGSSAAKAEVVADADETVADACTAYKVSAAIADSTRAKLTQLREQVAVGRSVLVGEREADKIHSQGGTP